MSSLPSNIFFILPRWWSIRITRKNRGSGRTKKNSLDIIQVLLIFFNELIKEMKFQGLKLTEKSRRFKVIERSAKYLSVIYNFNLATETEVDESVDLERMLKIIQECPLPAHIKDVKPKIIDDKITGGGTEEIDSDIDLEPAPGTKVPPKGWCNTKGEREVSKYLKNLIDSAVDGPAKQVIQALGPPRDRTGLQAIKELVRVYGRSAAHVCMLPATFAWGKKQFT